MPRKWHTAKQSARQIQGIERAAQAVDLRRQGKSYEQIAKVMKVSRQRAFQLVKRGLSLVIREPAESLLALEADRLDKSHNRLERIINKLVPTAEQGDVDSLRMVIESTRAQLAISQRRAKMLGLDAPESRVVAMKIEQSFALKLDELERVLSPADFDRVLPILAGRPMLPSGIDSEPPPRHDVEIVVDSEPEAEEPNVEPISRD